MFDVQKVGQGVQFSQLDHSMANIKIYKCDIFTVVIFAMRKILTDGQTQIHTETDKPMAIGKIVQI